MILADLGYGKRDAKQAYVASGTRSSASPC
jgi:hypothetical protein